MIDLLLANQPERAKDLHYARRDEVALQGAFDVWKGDQYHPEFIKINPNSKIPAIIDHDGPGGKPYTLFEFGRDPNVSGREGRQIPADRHGEEIPCAAVAVRPDLRASVRCSASSPTSRCSRRRAAIMPTRWRAIRPRSSGSTKFWKSGSPIRRRSLPGDEYTIADIATYPWTRNHDIQGVKWEDNPNSWRAGSSRSTIGRR